MTMGTTPSKAEIHVATDTLRAEAGKWQQESQRLGNITQQVQAQDVTRLEAGIFQVVVDGYQQVVHAVATRCQEGQQRTAEIADTLRKAADTYDTEEAKNDHMIRNLY
jgi:uncharacterized protein YukE